MTSVTENPSLSLSLSLLLHNISLWMKYGRNVTVKICNVPQTQFLKTVLIIALFERVSEVQ